MNTRQTIYGSAVFTTIFWLGFNSYRRNNFNSIYNFFNDMLNIESVIPLSIFGALQVKCINAVINKYIDN